MTKSFSDLSIVIPAYNEELGISCVLQSLLDHLPGAEIIVVDDASQDSTQQRVLEFVKKSDDVNLYQHLFNRGYGASLKTGVNRATRAYIAWFDADDEHRAEDLIAMYEIIRNKPLAAVIAKRKQNASNTMRRIGKLSIWLFGRTLGIKAGPDLNCGLRIFHRPLIKNYLSLLPNRYSASLTTTILLFERGYPIEYYPISVNKRKGKSKLKLKDGFFAIGKLLSLVILFAPMRIFFGAGLLLILIGSIYSFIIASLMKLGIPTAGGVLVLSGGLLCILGLLADQTSKARLSTLDPVGLDKKVE